MQDEADAVDGGKRLPSFGNSKKLSRERKQYRAGRPGVHVMQ